MHLHWGLKEQGIYMARSLCSYMPKGLCSYMTWGVIQISSDRDDRRVFDPLFWCLKFWLWDFLGRKILASIFWVACFKEGFFGVFKTNWRFVTVPAYAQPFYSVDAWVRVVELNTFPITSSVTLANSSAIFTTVFPSAISSSLARNKSQLLLNADIKFIK